MKLTIFAAVAMVSMGLAGCAESGLETSNNSAAPAVKTLAAGAVTHAVCTIEGTKGNAGVKGEVHYEEKDGKMKVTADISGLKPGSKHAIHIHEGTECGEDGMAAKAHYNPDKHPHGLPDAKEKHAGDFGNLEADKDGKAHLELTVDNITIAGAKNPVIGHAMIVHANPDDGSQPAGNAGARIGCGIIKATPAKK